MSSAAGFVCVTPPSTTKTKLKQTNKQKKTNYFKVGTNEAKILNY